MHRTISTKSVVLALKKYQTLAPHITVIMLNGLIFNQYLTAVAELLFK
jgi:hypothetical protein